VLMENQKVRKCKKQLMKQFKLCSQGTSNVLSRFEGV